MIEGNLAGIIAKHQFFERFCEGCDWFADMSDSPESEWVKQHAEHVLSLLSAEVQSSATRTLTPHSSPVTAVGPPCISCKRPMKRTYYRDADVDGKRRAVVMDTCPCAATTEGIGGKLTNNIVADVPAEPVVEANPDVVVEPTPGDVATDEPTA